MYGSGDGEFQFPRAATAGYGGIVYVVDLGNQRCQKFGSPDTPTTTTTWGRLKALYR